VKIINDTSKEKGEQQQYNVTNCWAKHHISRDAFQDWRGSNNITQGIITECIHKWSCTKSQIRIWNKRQIPQRQFLRYDQDCWYYGTVERGWHLMGYIQHLSYWPIHCHIIHRSAAYLLERCGEAETSQPLSGCHRKHSSKNAWTNGSVLRTCHKVIKIR
jgi:hypothetical protein